MNRSATDEAAGPPASRSAHESQSGTPAGTGTCRPDGCARLCTEQGIAAAHAAYHARCSAALAGSSSTGPRRGCRPGSLPPGLAGLLLVRSRGRTAGELAPRHHGEHRDRHGQGARPATPAGVRLGQRERTRGRPHRHRPADPALPATHALTSIEAQAPGMRWSRRCCAIVRTPTLPPSSAWRQVPCAPGSTTGCGGCAACSKPAEACAPEPR